ncbi:L-threonylcarbamoyladenylate synthase, partial [Glutamicibacter sp.]
WPGGLTLILQAQPSLTWDLGETRGTVGLRVPNDDTALELLRETGPLAVSSANRSGQPAALDVDSAMEQLGESVDVYLDGGSRGEDPTQVLPSTIIDCTGEHLKVVRAGAISIEELRVVVPEVLDLGQDAPGQDA